MPTSENEKTKPKMKNITLYIPTQHEDSIQTLMKYELTPSRSGFIRESIYEFLKTKLPYFKDLEQFHEIIVNHPILEERRSHPTWRK